MAFAYEIVEGQFETIKEYADETFVLASSAIANLSTLIDEQLTNITAPELNEVDVAQSFDIDPSIQQIYNGVENAIDALNVDNIEVPTTIPVFTEHDMPVHPGYVLPTIPTLTDISIPDFEEEIAASLSSVLPVMDFIVPDISSQVNEALAQGSIAPQLSDLNLAEVVESKLVSNIQNGGTMLNQDVEADIWARDLERNEQQLADSIDKATSQWAKFGFSLPDGALADQLLAINNEYMNRRIDRSREIAIKQAELEQQGVFKSLELGTQFITMWFGVVEAYRQRTISSAKITADTLLELYKTRVLKINTELELFKVDLEQWKTAINRELARVQVYKTRIEALGIVAGIDETKVKLYAAQVQGLSELVKVWNTEIQAVATMYEAEKSKVEVFRSQVQAYATQVEAIARKQTVAVESLKAYVTGWSASADAKVKLVEAKTRVDVARWQIVEKEWEVELSTKERELSIRLEALKTAASASSNIAAGALSAAHASASASFGASTSTSYNHSFLD